jgi:4'-phosphopantetheinyl transferase
MSGDSVRIHLERLAEDATPPRTDAFNATELARLARMRNPLRRRQFVAGHRLARALAAQLAGNAPEAWDLIADAAGTPRLRAVDGTASMHASLAHSGDWVGCALSPAPLGLDLETDARERDLDAVAAYAFAAEHAADVAARTGAAKAQAFYRWWTLAEAEGKHAGHGLHPHRTRGLAWRECRIDQAEGVTWRGDGFWLALWSPGRVRAEVTGAEVEAPRYWRVESADDASG